VRPAGRHRRLRTRQWLGAAAMLVFALRALIPAGYMLAAVEGHTRLVMCPAGVYHGVPRHAMSDMGHALGMNHAAHEALAADHCPFALAGGSGLLSAASLPVEPYFVFLRPGRAQAIASVPTAPPSRYHAPRGPPALA
jgi:hypothetical protein